MEGNKMSNYYIRFMSNGEYSKLIMGLELENEREHSRHANSESKGFCFLPVDTVREVYGRPSYGTWLTWVMHAWDIVGGVASDAVAVVFRDEGANLKESSGIYADLMSDDWNDTMEVREVCTTSYDKYDMVPVFVADGFRDNWFEYDREWRQKAKQCLGIA